jgi:hypothetical protein
VQALSEACLKLDRGFCHPFQLRVYNREDKNNLEDSKMDED